jgi:DNA polymerase III epsilon subunit-like protein
MKSSFTTFSKNIIFVDTEFSSLDPYKGEILSIGMVDVEGKELYLELEYDDKIDPWVKKNIIPTLKAKKVSRQKAANEIRKFVGKGKPYMMAYVNQYDTLYLYKLLGKNKPFNWLPIDFAAILFGMGINPEVFDVKEKDNFFSEIGVDPTKYHQHNALDDAKLLREVYLKMTKKLGLQSEARGKSRT